MAIKPPEVAFDRVDRETNDLHVALVELGLDLGHVAQFGGAHRREVLGVAEQHAPAVAEPVVEIDVALRCGCIEVWCDVTKSNGHAGYSSRSIRV